MATSFAGIKRLLDVPSWQLTSLIYNATHTIQTSGVGMTLAGDKRASQYKLNNLWYLTGATASFNKYDTIKNGWAQLPNPTLGGAMGAGASTVFCPSHGPRGTIAAGATTTTVTLSTVLPASVGVNSLVGKRIRIIGNNAAGSGKTEERTIVSNTSGTTPIITMDSALSFTPGTGAGYELLTGRVYMLSSGTTAAGFFKYYDEATNSISGNLATTNLPATIGTDSSVVSLDELHTPITGVNGVAINGEVGGYFGTLTATASAATTLTGQAASGDAAVLANEYRNFQIRIVEDTATPTAVGQRRRITSHTAGASPVYTVPTWTVTPSATAKYMIENNNDIILWTGATTNTHRYEWIGNTWDTTTYAVLPATNAAGATAFHPFGIVLNAGKTLRHSYIYRFRGGSTATLDVFDIAAATTGAWTSSWSYANSGSVTFSTGGASAYSVVDNKCVVIPQSFSNLPINTYVFDIDKNKIEPYAAIQQPPSSPTTGDRLALDFFIDGTDKKAVFYHIPGTTALLLRSLFIL
jgi:hypothetical protein